MTTAKGLLVPTDVCVKTAFELHLCRYFPNGIMGLWAQSFILGMNSTFVNSVHFNCKKREKTVLAKKMVTD